MLIPRQWIVSFCPSIVALIVALGVPALAFIIGHTSDPIITRIMNSPSVIERWEERSRGSIVRGPSTTESPLVQEAKRFALLLNPPHPKATSGTTTTERGVANPGAPKPPRVRPAETRPKFTLIATSLYPADTSESMALISEPGENTRWIKPGTKLGYLVIEQILPGAIVYRDGSAQHRLEIDAGEALAERTIEAGRKQPNRYARHVAKAEPSLPLEHNDREAIARARKRPKFHRLGPIR